MNLNKLKKLKNTGSFLIINIFAIVILGGLTVYTATSDRTLSFVIKDVFFIIIGFAAFLFFATMDYRKYVKYSTLLYILNLLMLLAVLVLGSTKLGAKRWIDFGFFQFQPSEFSKIIVILTLSNFLVARYTTKKNDGFSKIFMSLLHILPILLLVLKQPDLGTTLGIVFVYFVILFVSGINWRVFGGIMGIIAVAIPVVYNFFLKAYQKQRILTFLDPEADKLGSGWNVTQSKIAIGSGGFLGKGIFNSTQSKLRFLPESHTDFVGSVFLEEFGLIGAIIILGLYWSLVIQIMDIGDKSRDEYGKYLCYGIAGVFIFHVLINVGMIVGIMPVTGKPLLLMSYGGTSMILSFIMLGIVQSVKMHRD